MTDFDDARAPLPDQARAESPRTPQHQRSQEDPEEISKESLAVRRIKKLRLKNPEATPAEIANSLAQLFIRDFSLVGGAEAGVGNLIPGALNVATRNSKVAGLTRAAAQIGVVQGAATYTQKSAQGVATAAHVGSAQSIKTYIFALALLHRLPAHTAEQATEQVLVGDVHQLLHTMEQPIAHQPNQKGATPLNVISAISQIGLRNPQMFLLVKSGEQLVRSGGSILENTKARKEFAQQLVLQVRENLGAVPADFPAQFAQLEAPHIPQDPATVVATPPEQVAATSSEDLERIAQQNTAPAKGARLAARAFAKGAQRTGLFGFNKEK
ncbi:MAG: hypothetical protein Q3974_07425 [Rothia sp. (in: high G+C Gram-positive bacteria)]|nr:hypothetical protein [Rothia sp. (in: high G+C Gram-positive bacteria)]